MWEHRADRSLASSAVNLSKRRLKQHGIKRGQQTYACVSGLPQAKEQAKGCRGVDTGRARPTDRVKGQANKQTDRPIDRPTNNKSAAQYR